MVALNLEAELYSRHTTKMKMFGKQIDKYLLGLLLELNIVSTDDLKIENACSLKD